MLPASARVADNMVQRFFDGDVTDVSNWTFELDLTMSQDIFESVCSLLKVDGCSLISTGVFFKALRFHGSYQTMVNAALKIWEWIINISPDELLEDFKYENAHEIANTF